jgi:hypothetical protein
MIVVYPGGFHGEFFVGNIVENNPNKFHYYSFLQRDNNAYKYIPVEEANSDNTRGGDNTTDEKLSIYEKTYKKKIIVRSHNHSNYRKYPVLRLCTQDQYYMRRCKLLQTAKSFHIKHKHMPPQFLNTVPWKMKPISDNMIVIDIAKWLHNDMQTIHKIEHFFGIKYSKKMKKNVIGYYNRDETILEKYFKGWTSWSDEYLLERILVVWNKHNTLDKL